MEEQKAAIEEFGRLLSHLPQENIPTEHYFANGMYARVMGQAKGSIVVGKQHKHAHFLLILSGAVRLTGGGEAVTYHAPSIVVSEKGAQRAIFALEDSSYMTIHKTEETDLDKIEAEIIEPIEGARLDSGNRVIKLAVEEKP